MAIKRINVGGVANDGTGDDLREAFVKVNDNFAELDARQYETTTATNLGVAGVGVFAGQSGSQLQFKKLVGGAGTTIDQDNNSITINTGATGLDRFQLFADNGNINVDTDGQHITFAGGGNTTVTVNQNTDTFTISSFTSLATDTSPRLTADLDAGGRVIFGAQDIRSPVYGIDIRGFAGAEDFVNGIDFGTFPTRKFAQDGQGNILYDYEARTVRGIFDWLIATNPTLNNIDFGVDDSSPDFEQAKDGDGFAIELDLNLQPDGTIAPDGFAV